MSRPGVEVTSAAAAPPVGVPTDTSVVFMVGEATQGPVDAPTRITSLDGFQSVYGDRIAGCEGYDSVDAYFHEGGTAAYFQRLTDGAALASGDAASVVAGNTVQAASPGAWANALELDVVSAPALSKSKQPEQSELLTYEPKAGSPGFLATIKLGGSAVSTSAELYTRRDLSNYLQASAYLRLVGPDSDDPLAVGTVVLTGGDDGVVPVADVQALPAALDLINPELGPGQLCAPGKTALSDHAALLSSAAATNRYALLDCDPDDDALAAQAKVASLRGALEDRFGMLWAPWAVVPGIAPGTRRTVPWSAIQAGLIARNDAAGNPNQAAAGSWGISQYALDLSETYSASDMEDMLYAGVCTARRVYGGIEAYAFRSLVDPAGQRAQWVQANHGRLAMAIVAESEAVGQDFVFSQIDGRGLTIAAFNGALAAVCKGFYDDGALYAEPGSNDPSTAFVVNTGPAVNTPDKLADGILSAVISVRMSPHAELVQITIVKYPITVTLA
jgi:phage tail sheath protein FI